MEINEILAKLPKAPAGVERWIRSDLIENTYIIYSKKENKAVCTHCGHAFKADRFHMRHNEEGTCPGCHRKAIYKASGIGRGNLSEHLRVLLFTHRGETVYGTLHEVVADFSPFGKPKLKRWLSAVYKFNEKEQIYYKHHPGYWSGEYWERRKNIKLPAPPSPHNWYLSSIWKPAEIYSDNLETVFRKSCLKYLWSPQLFEGFEPKDYIRYMDQALKYQSIELLNKAGFSQLVKCRINDSYGAGAVNWRGKDLKKILRLPRRWIRFLQDHDPNYDELAVFRSLSEKEKREVIWSEVESIVTASYLINEITKYTSMYRWARYKSEQNEGDCFDRDWLDYIKNCRKLGMDTTKKDTLFPKDFKRAHDMMAEAVEIQMDEERTNLMRKAVPEISIESGGLVAFTARTQASLNRESEELNHCVRTYGDRIIRGSCYIFFVRMKEAPDIPYYTMETDLNGKVIQCRGKNNCSMTEEVQAFVEEFKKQIRKELRKLERSAA